MTSPARSNSTIAVLAAALIVPRVQRMLGVTLTVDDVAALMALLMTAWHAGAATFERYFPPPNPITPEKPAQETK